MTRKNRSWRTWRSFLIAKRPFKEKREKIGEGVIVRYDEKAREIVGLTIIGLMARLTEGEMRS